MNFNNLIAWPVPVYLKVRFWPSTVGTADFALFGLPQMWHAVRGSAAGNMIHRVETLKLTV
jgi:hypothetical protein